MNPLRKYLNSQTKDGYSRPVESILSLFTLLAVLGLVVCVVRIVTGS